jgi:phage gp45-like
MNLKQRLLKLLGRAVIVEITEQGGRQTMTIKVGLGDTRTDCERLQNYGAASWPTEDCDAVYAALAASRNSTVVVSAQDPNRPPLEVRGDSMIYTAAGNKAYCHIDGSISLIAAAGKPLKVSASKAEFDCPIHSTGDITSDGDIKAGGISLKLHKTSGVVPGSGQSGVPVP